MSDVDRVSFRPSEWLKLGAILLAQFVGVVLVMRGDIMLNKQTIKTNRELIDQQQQQINQSNAIQNDTARLLGRLEERLAAADRRIDRIEK